MWITVLVFSTLFVVGDATKSKVKFTEKGKMNITAVHNVYRSRIAKGATINGVPVGPAQNMNLLKWSDKLAASAQEHSITCPDYHSRNLKAGENIYMQTGMKKHESVDRLGLRAVSSWYNEIVSYGWPSVKFNSTTHAKIGHATQVLWSSVREVGCGVSTCNKEGGLETVHVVCHYFPSGNVENNDIFRAGEKCTYCSRLNLLKCHQGLCVLK